MKPTMNGTEFRPMKKSWRNYLKRQRAKKVTARRPHQKVNEEDLAYYHYLLTRKREDFPNQNDYHFHLIKLATARRLCRLAA